MRAKFKEGPAEAIHHVSHHAVKVAPQAVVFLRGRGQIAFGLLEPLFLERRESGKIRTIGQVSRLLGVLKGLILIADNQLSATVHQGLLVIRSDKPPKKTQTQAVFRGNRRNGRGSRQIGSRATRSFSWKSLSARESRFGNVRRGPVCSQMQQ